MSDVFAPKITYRVVAMNVHPMFMDTELPDPNWPSNLYGLPYGWAGQVSYPNRTNFEDHFQMYRDMVAWIKEHVKNPEQNVLWNKIGDCIYVQFRKQKDKTWFTLRFGA